MARSVVRLEGISKRYRRGGWVGRDVDAEIPPGETVAFSGGNGSGKSTLLRVLAGVTRPTDGTVTGRPAVVGYVPDRFSPTGRLSALSYLTHMGRIRGLPTGSAKERAHRLLERLSGRRRGLPPAHPLQGDAQKVALGQALLTEPCAGARRAARCKARSMFR